MADSLSIALDLPDVGQMRSLLSDQIRKYDDRNRLIARLRESLAGRNAIKAPANVSYKVEVAHTYHLLAAQNEKEARFLPLPKFKVVPWGIGTTAQSAATRQGEALNRLWEVTEEQSGGRSWSRQVSDAILTDGGWQRIERAPAALWPELTLIDFEHPEKGERLYASRPFEDPDEYARYREVYKRDCPVPIRRVYVPHECIFPTWDGPALMEVVEFERRLLRNVLTNRLFTGAGLEQLRGLTGSKTQSDQYVVICHYANQKYHSYWALGPDQDSRYSGRWPDALRPTKMSIGTPVFLYGYEHKLNRPDYSGMGGRSDSWRGTNNAQLEAIMEALLELGQDSDEAYSQWKTNLRHQGWPTYAAYYNAKDRGLAAGDPMPKPIQIQEGQNISMLTDERIENVVKPMDIMAIEAFLNFSRSRMAELAGAPALYGQRQPGVTTGYHENLQITQAEHLDNNLEAGIAAGALDANAVIFGHIDAMGERLPLFVQKKAQGRIFGDFIYIEPADLHPRPQMSVKVRAPRPVDLLTNAQAFMQLTSDRAGPGTPAVDDTWGRENLLGVDYPDEMDSRIKIQNAMREAAQTGVVRTEVMQRLNLELIARGTPSVSPGMAQQADPALIQAAMQMGTQGEAAGMGGLSPQLATSLASAGQGLPMPAPMPMGSPGLPTGPKAGGTLMGMGGGSAPGAPQPQQQIGRAPVLMAGGQ